MGVSWYARVLSHYPFTILITILVFSATCLIVPFVTNQLPDFSDPQLGFEARGTVLAQRLVAWKNLLESSGPRGSLTNNPLEYYYYLQEINRQNKEATTETSQTSATKNKTKKNHKKHKKHNKDVKNTPLKHDDSQDKKDRQGDSSQGNDYQNNTSDAGNFFCNEPSSAYARVVISSKGEKQNLWSLQGVLAQCHIDAALRANPHFSLLCQRKIQSKNECCQSWMPANYIAFFSNKSSCLAVTESDLLKVESILEQCSYFYRNFELTADCGDNWKCQRNVPASCYVHNAAYHLLHYLLEMDFRINNNDNNTVKPHLHSAMIVLPIAASSASLDYYKDLNIPDINYEDIHISAIQFGLKSTLFDRLLISDSFLVLLGFAFVTICIWSYTGSLLITVSTILVVIFSLGIAYAIYVLILKINVFPFMNLLTIIVAIGIGADDTFIFCKIWECNKRQMSRNTSSNLTRLVHETMKHAVPSMFVTTLTTAVAFFASIVSNVTAINCFSIFSGMTVIINFLLTVTWLPASVIIAERCGTNVISPTNFIMRKITLPLQLFIDKVARSFVNFLVQLVTLLKYFWFTAFLALGIGSCFVVFHYPGLQLPDSPEFQLFDGSHLFEQYDLVYAKRFWFEKLERGDGGEVLPLRFVWGILPVDNGDYLNPASRGSLVMDENFDVSSRESQIWLLNFCKNLRMQSFYQSTLGPLLLNCFVESLVTWMERPCEDPVDPTIDHSPCCRRNSFPYEPAVLKRCTADAVAEIYKTPTHLWNFRPSQSYQTTGLKFRKQNDSAMVVGSNADVPEIQAVIVEYDSNFVFSLSFAEMNNFFNQVETWMQGQLATAPAGMKSGWFVSNLEFYELQRTLYDGTIWAIVVSMGLALSVLALITLNPFVSLYAILTVGAAINITVAIFISIGWKLNVLESIAVSTAIGLAVDFSLHYSVSYRASTANGQVKRVKETLEQMGGPTLMAALTTSAAGAFMLPSRVLAYIQIGIFLLIIMSVSWVCATFFLCSLFLIADPSFHFSYAKFRRSFLSWNRKVTSDSEEPENDASINKIRRQSKDNIPLDSIRDAAQPPSSNTALLNVNNIENKSNST